MGSKAAPGGAPTAGAPTSAGPAPLHIGFKISTTSDWTTIRVEGGTLSQVKVNSSSPEATTAGFNDSLAEFDLNQPLDRAGKAVQMQVESYVTNVAGPTLRLTIGRGHIGATQVEVDRFDGAGPVAVKTVEWADIRKDIPENAQSYEIPVALLTGTAAALPAASASAGTQVRIGLEIITTSDWTSVSLTGATLSGTQVTSSSPEATASSFDQALSQFSLQQALERAGGQSVRLTAETLLLQIPNSGLSVTIDRGGIGATRVIVFRIDAEHRTLVRTLMWTGTNLGGTPNSRTFNIPAEELLKPSNSVAAASGPLHIGVQISTSSDWTTVKISGGALSNVKILASSPEAINASFDEATTQFNFSQPLERGGKRSVDMTAEALLAVQAASIITFTIDRGGLGSTQLQVYRYDGDRQIRVTTLVWADLKNDSSGNAQSFEIPGAVMLGLESAAGAQAGTQDVIVPDTTKIMDSGLRQDLQSVGPDGTLRFAKSTPALQALEPGDVLVSDISEAAPDGLLRKVRAVHTEGEGVVVETEDALLTEAVERGHGSVHVELGADDIVSMQILHPGVRFVETPQNRVGPYDISSSTGPARSLPALSYAFNADFGTGHKIEMGGYVKFQPILDADANISCDETRDYGFADICDEIPDLNFMAQVGIEESSKFSVGGSEGASLNADPIEIATIKFDTIVVPVGPIPVVLRPSLMVYLRGDGHISAKVSYSVEQTLTLTAGFRYNSDHGFENLSKKDASFTNTGPTFDGEASLTGVVGLKVQILVYGLIGPFGALEAGVQMRGNMAGIGPPSLLWKLEGCVWLSVGINSVPVLGLEWSDTTPVACVDIATGENRAPSVTILSPAENTRWAEGKRLLKSRVVDMDGSAYSCRWESNVGSDDLTLMGTNCSGGTVNVVGGGPHTFKLTATDSGGTAASDTVTVNVKSAPPTPVPPFFVSISSPGDGSVINQSDPVTVQGAASGGTEPYSFSWSLVYPATEDGEPVNPRMWPYLLGADQTFAWTPSATLSVEGCGDLGKLMLDVTDATGKTAPASILIRIARNCIK